MTRARRWALAAAIVTAVLLATAGVADAHAELDGTDPPADAVLASSPQQIVLTFTESVDPIAESLRLVAADGTEVAIGDVTQERGADTVTASVDEPLHDGTYAVAWAVVSADSHPIRGAFTFSVGAPSATAPGLAADVLGETGPGASNDRWLGVGRFASFAGIAVLVGLAAAVVVLAPGELASRRTGDVLTGAGMVAMAGTIVMIAAQARTIDGSVLAWTSVADTRAGRWWAVRLIAVAVATVVVPWRRHLDRTAVRAAAVVVAVVLFAVVAAGGHSSSGRAVGLAMVTTVVHLAAMSVWVGGVVALLVAVPRADVWSAAARFSPIALWAVVALAVSGTANGLRQIDGWGELVDSSYGRWLAVKLAVVAGVVLVAARVRSQVRTRSPRTDRVPTAAGVGAAIARSSTDSEGVRRALRVEAIGMLAVLAATAGLAGAPPPRTSAAASAPANVAASATQGERVAYVDVIPAVTGGTTMHVTITSPPGTEPADELTVTAALPARDLGPIDVPVTLIAPDHATTIDADFPVAGTWVVTVTARYGEFDQVVFDVDVPVTDR